MARPPDEYNPPMKHFVSGRSIVPPFPEGTEKALFAMGCFWGAEKKFWQSPGVYTTAVGYAAGSKPDPTYREVCSAAPGMPKSSSSSSIRRKRATRAF